MVKSYDVRDLISTMRVMISSQLDIYLLPLGQTPFHITVEPGTLHSHLQKTGLLRLTGSCDMIRRVKQLFEIKKKKPYALKRKLVNHALRFHFGNSCVEVSSRLRSC